MAIYDINTIQGDVNTSYGDEYIKQALANLGQRQGLKGDAIHTQSFKITDVIFDETDKTDKIIPTSYIKGYYDVKNDEIIYTADNDDLSNPLFTYRLSEIVSNAEIVNLYLLSAENVNLAPKYVDCKIIKKQSDDSYYFIGKGIQDNETANIVVLEFSEYGVNLIDGLYFEQVEADKVIMMHYDDASQKEYSGVSLSNIYSTLKEYDSIDNILNLYVNNIVTLDNNPNNDGSIIEEEHNNNVLTIFSYISSVLITEIKTTYNDSIYKVDGNGYLGLKRRIVYELIKHIYVEFNKIDSKTDTGITVYFDKDFYISYISNTNTDVIYISYDITFRGRGINNTKLEPEFDYKNNANMFLADILTDEDRYVSYKFYVQYIDDDKYVDSIYIEQTSILPYIGKDESLSDVWYINGEQTNVHATGADAGNPNIMFVSYTLNESSSKDESVIDIDVLHTYTDDNVTLEKINNAFENEAIMQTFYYDLGNTVNVANSIDKNYEFNIPLPDPNKLAKNTGFENFIKNVLIFAIIDVKISSTVIDNETLHSLISGNGPSSYITVFFHISKNEEGKYTWTPILNPLYNSETPIVSSSSMAPVLDLSSMTSLRQLMNYYVQVAFKPDVYYHRWVVFTSTNEVLKNTGKDINSDAKYPVFKVDTGKEYYGTASFNTLNFTPKFVLEKNVIEDNGRINSINDASPDNASFTIENGTISAVTPVIKVDAENNTDDNLKTEFIPNAKLDQNLEINDSYPMLDLREVFVNNQTLLNRLSIITTSGKVEEGTDRYPIYHAYIGHRYSDEAVNSLVIGTSNEVYNMQNSYTMAREITDTNGEKIPGWKKFKLFDNLKIALPLFAELNATFEGEKIEVTNKNSIFSVASERISFENTSNDASFTLKNPTINISSSENNILSIVGNATSLVSDRITLKDSTDTYSIIGAEGNVGITAKNDITNTANNSIKHSISNSGQYIEISHDKVTISDDNNNNSEVDINSNVVAINSKNNITLTNKLDNANKQSIVLDKSNIKLDFNGTNAVISSNKIATNAQTIETTVPVEIQLYNGEKSTITGGNDSNVIEYRPNGLYISTDDALTLNGNDSVDISGNGPLTVSTTETTFENPVTINDKLTATGDVKLGSASSTLKFNASSTEFNTGTTSFSADLSVAGNVTATNVTVNGLLVTKTSSVTGILTWSDSKNHWGFEYPYWENENRDNLIDKEFLFGFTTIDLSFIYNNEEFNASDVITDTKKYVNGACTYDSDGNGIPKANTRNFLLNGQTDNPYIYSNLSLNLTAFLNEYSDDSMFVRGEYKRPNLNNEVVITKVDDVIIPLANPTLYNLPSTVNETYWKANNKHRLKTFMLFIERFTFWNDANHSFSTGDVYALRGAKEVSMTMDNFNPDMVNHIYNLETYPAQNN